MRRICIKITLTIIFALLTITIIIFFRAEQQFEVAKKMENDYRWKKAAEEFKKAVYLNPVNAKHLAGYADFLTRQNFFCNNTTTFFEETEEFYKNAIKLNPLCAEYWLKAGQAKLYKNKPSIAFNDFQKALENDPSGFNTAYSISYMGMSVWNFLDKTQKQLVFNRSRYSLLLKPWYGRYIYPQAWQHTKDFKFLRKITPNALEPNRCLYYFVTRNNLWTHYTAQKKAIDFYLKKEKPEEFEKANEEKERLFRSLHSLAMTGELDNWIGKSKKGENIYKNGNMYWTGTISKAIDLPRGDFIIKIEAKGSQANGAWPYMIVDVEGEEIGETFVDSEEWKKYDFTTNTDGGVKILSVTFANDEVNARKKEDRNLYIGSVQIIKNDQ